MSEEAAVVQLAMPLELEVCVVADSLLHVAGQVKHAHAAANGVHELLVPADRKLVSK